MRLYRRMWKGQTEIVEYYIVYGVDQHFWYAALDLNKWNRSHSIWGIIRATDPQMIEVSRLEVLLATNLELPEEPPDLGMCDEGGDHVSLRSSEEG